MSSPSRIRRKTKIAVHVYANSSFYSDLLKQKDMLLVCVESDYYRYRYVKTAVYTYLWGQIQMQVKTAVTRELCTVQKFGVVWLPKLASGFRVFYTTKRTVYYFHLPGQLKPDYRGPPSFQGASGPAPSSTSLQEKLSMSQLSLFCITHLLNTTSVQFWLELHTNKIIPIACNALTVCYVIHVNGMSSLLARDYKTEQIETFYAANPVGQWPYCVLKFESLIIASTHTRLNTHSNIRLVQKFLLELF